MAEPSTLTQTAINVANMDFTQRVTPHPQVVSPLQQLIVEDQQVKEDPGNDEIEGLDAKVLLNTDPLEDGEPVTLDFKGQEDLPSMHPLPSHNSHRPPTLQQSPPASAQPSTSATDNQPKYGNAPSQLSNNQPIPCPSPRHVRWLQSQGPI